MSVRSVRRSRVLSIDDNNTVRFTPFGRSTQRRRLGRVSHVGDRTPQVAPEHQGEQEANLKGLTFKTWKVYRLSPLHKFSVNPRDLKRYASSLSVSTEALQEKGLFVENTNSGKALISLYYGLKETPTDPEAVQILIKGKTKTGDQEIVQLTAVLCGVGMEENPLPQNMSNKFKYYPLMLVKGTMALTDLLISWLQDRFDCKVTAMVIPPYELSWMVAMWSGTVIDEGRKSKQIQLRYKIPAECEGISWITYTIEPEDCLKLWKSVHDSDSNDFTAEEVTDFIKALEGHFYELFHVKLPAMCLSFVGTSLGYIGADGRLKIFSKNNALTVLRHFTELSKEHFILGN